MAFYDDIEDLILKYKIYVAGVIVFILLLTCSCLAYYKKFVCCKLNEKVSKERKAAAQKLKFEMSLVRNQDDRTLLAEQMSLPRPSTNGSSGKNKEFNLDEDDDLDLLLKSSSKEIKHENLWYISAKPLTYMQGGGFGSVFKGRHSESRTESRNCAIREMKVNGNLVQRRKVAKLLSASMAELSDLEKMSEHNLVGVLGICETVSTKLILITDWVPMGSLYDILFANKNIPIKDAVKFAWITTIAQAMEYLHDIVCMSHGNLKTGNILMDDDGRLKITDIGLSHFRVEASREEFCLTSSFSNMPLPQQPTPPSPVKKLKSPPELLLTSRVKSGSFDAVSEERSEAIVERLRSSSFSEEKKGETDNSISDRTTRQQPPSTPNRGSKSSARGSARGMSSPRGSSSARGMSSPRGSSTARGMSSPRGSSSARGASQSRGSDGDMILVQDHKQGSNRSYGATLRYAAPEVLEAGYQVCGVKESCDVYAFGSLVYEIIERRVPWANDDNSSIITNVVMKEQRPQFTDVTKNPMMVTLTKQCWQKESSDRPTFAQIVSVIEEGSLSAANGIASLPKKSSSNSSFSSSRSSAASSTTIATAGSEEAFSTSNKKTSPYTKKRVPPPPSKSSSLSTHQASSSSEKKEARGGSAKRPSSTPSMRPGTAEVNLDADMDFGNENTHFFQLRSESSQKAVGSAV